MRFKNLIRCCLPVLLIATVAAGRPPGRLLSGITASEFAPVPTVLGTWKGESTCVGNRPACKNEVVVYRFEAVPGQPDRITLLADKIIEGKRVPMYKLQFQYDEARASLSCEFTKRLTHGVWQYKMTGETMEGTLILLPDKSLGRRVKVSRISPDQVPAAPAKEQYEES